MVAVTKVVSSVRISSVIERLNSKQEGAQRGVARHNRMGMELVQSKGEKCELMSKWSEMNGETCNMKRADGPTN